MPSFALIGLCRIEICPDRCICPARSALIGLCRIEMHEVVVSQQVVLALIGLCRIEISPPRKELFSTNCFNRTL